ncbi:MAG: hypothetical protein IT462_04920 [Planctomycetes bacterium]|nr:hypothetical protein [Planctomycetota bacterium]
MPATTEQKLAKAATEDVKPVEKPREPLWSTTGLIIMIAVWLVTLGLGIVGVMLFAGAPSAGASKAEPGKGAARSYGLVDNVRVTLPDDDGSTRVISFNLLLEFAGDAGKSAVELESGHFKHAISFQAEELLRGYSVRQASERSFARDFGAALKRQLNDLYGSTANEYVRAVLVQKLSIGG